MRPYREVPSFLRVHIRMQIPVLEFRHEYYIYEVCINDKVYMLHDIIIVISVIFNIL